MSPWFRRKRKETTEQQAAPQAPQAPPTATQTSTSGADMDVSALLQTNEQLAAQLGDEYVQGHVLAPAVRPDRAHQFQVLEENVSGIAAGS